MSQKSLNSKVQSYTRKAEYFEQAEVEIKFKIFITNCLTYILFVQAVINNKVSSITATNQLKIFVLHSSTTIFLYVILVRSFVF